jgi:hypothetical protein
MLAVDIALERRTHMHRWRHSAGGVLDFSSGMHRQGFKLHCGLPGDEGALYCSS